MPPMWWMMWQTSTMLHALVFEPWSLSAPLQSRTIVVSHRDHSKDEVHRAVASLSANWTAVWTFPSPDPVHWQCLHPWDSKEYSHLQREGKSQTSSLANQWHQRENFTGLLSSLILSQPFGFLLVPGIEKDEYIIATDANQNKCRHQVHEREDRYAVYDTIDEEADTDR